MIEHADTYLGVASLISVSWLLAWAIENLDREQKIEALRRRAERAEAERNAHWGRLQETMIRLSAAEFERDNLKARVDQHEDCTVGLVEKLGLERARAEEAEAQISAAITQQPNK